MRAYLTLPKRLEADVPVTIEAEADSEGMLLESITDQDLKNALSPLVEAKVLRACWTNSLCVDELGLYTATVLQGQAGYIKEDIKIKVWVIPPDDNAR